VCVSCTVDFAQLISIPGPTVLRVGFYIELPQMMRIMVNGVGANYNLTSWLGADDLRGLTCDEVCLQILESCWKVSARPSACLPLKSNLSVVPTGCPKALGQPQSLKCNKIVRFISSLSQTAKL